MAKKKTNQDYYDISPVKDGTSKIASSGQRTKIDQPMTDADMELAITPKLNVAINKMTDVFTRNRIAAELYYNGELPGNVQEGRSKAVARVFMRTIDIVLASMMRIFGNGTDSVRFTDPSGTQAEQAVAATDYVNYIYNVRNAGYHNTYEWIKAALMFRIGVMKVYWEENINVNPEWYLGLSEQERDLLLAEEDVEVIEETERVDPQLLAVFENALAQHEMDKAKAEDRPVISKNTHIDQELLPKLWDVKVIRTSTTKGIVCEVLPSEEYLFEPWKRGIDDRKMHSHSKDMSASELREMGFEEDILNRITFKPMEEEAAYKIEKLIRHKRESPLPSYSNMVDPSAWTTKVHEVYWWIDSDADGIQEHHKSLFAGQSNYVLLEDEIVDDHPFIIASILPMPFKLVGESLFDKTKELQDQETAIFRQMMDNLYQSNWAREAFDENHVNAEDLEDMAPGVKIPVSGSPSEAIMPLTPPSIAQNSLQALQYLDEQVSLNTGISPYNQGLDAEELNPTATGVSKIMNAGAMRTEAMARTFAENSMKMMARKILDLSVKHQDSDDNFYAHGKAYTVKPQDWKSNFDVVCESGIGANDRDTEAARLQGLQAIYPGLIQAQMAVGGNLLEGPLVTLKELYSGTHRLVSAMGLKSPEQYCGDPTDFIKHKLANPPPKPPQPVDPGHVELAKIEQHGQISDKKLQLAALKEKSAEDLKNKKLQLDTLHKKNEMDIQMKQLELEALKLHLGQQSDELVNEIEALRIHLDNTNQQADREVDIRGQAHDQHNAMMDRKMQDHGMTLDSMHQTADRHADLFKHTTPKPLPPSNGAL
jgi:hypothetical protein